MDVTTVYVNNLTEALRQITNYVSLGLATAVSALVLEERLTKRDEARDKPRRQPRDETPPLTFAGVSLAMSRGTAQTLLLGLCWVAGAMASVTVEGTHRIVDKLRATPDILAAACTFPSIATAPVLVALIGAALPLLLVLPIMWRMWSRIREAFPSERPFGLLFIFFVPYVPLALGLVRLDCRG